LINYYFFVFYFVCAFPFALIELFENLSRQAYKSKAAKRL